MQKMHEAANGSSLNAEQRRNDLPFLGAVVAGQRGNVPRPDDVRRKLEPMLPREQWQEFAASGHRRTRKSQRAEWQTRHFEARPREAPMVGTRSPNGSQTDGCTGGSGPLTGAATLWYWAVG
jgi:hypothetical protein